jgi:hypothetical protein
MSGLELLFAPIFSGLSTIAPIVSGAATIAGGAIAAQGQKAQAQAQQQALNYQAAQLEMKGKEEQAAAQREAFAHKREKDFALSALQARGAASGFAADDPTTLQIGSDIEKYGTLQQMMAAYGGKSRRAGLEASAAGSRAEGAAAVQGAKYSAAGTILGGVTSGFARLAQGLPSAMAGPSSYRYG